jgi:hypothetical protein
MAYRVSIYRKGTPITEMTQDMLEKVWRAVWHHERVSTSYFIVDSANQAIHWAGYGWSAKPDITGTLLLHEILFLAPKEAKLNTEDTYVLLDLIQNATVQAYDYSKEGVLTPISPTVQEKSRLISAVCDCCKESMPQVSSEYQPLLCRSCAQHWESCAKFEREYGRKAKDARKAAGL